MVVLDTDLLTLVQRKASPEYDRLDARLLALSPTRPICITVISFEEQMRGWLGFIARARTSERQVDSYRRLHRLLEDFCDRQVLEYDERAVEQYQQLVKARVRIGTMDLRIAAIALVNGATLLSRNLRDFHKVPGLQVEDWTTLES
jgi:tRNA(fMet)-specific endonuclease VapC